MSLLPQYLIPDEGRNVPIRTFTAQSLSDGVRAVNDLCESRLGIATQLSEEGIVDALAFATRDQVIYLSISDIPSTARACSNGLRLQSLLNGGDFTIAGFSMPRQAIHVRRDLCCHVSGVDLSTVSAPSTRQPWDPASFVKNKVCADADRHGILKLWYPTKDNKEKRDRTCLQAWIAALCCQFYHGGPKLVDTRRLDDDELAHIGNLLRSVELLERAKPLKAENEFTVIESKKDGNLRLENARFKTRVRRSENTQIVMESASGQRVTGQAIRAEGRGTTIQITGGTYCGGIERVRVEGREELTCAENARDEFILRLLQGDVRLRDNTRPFIDLVWFPSSDFTRQTRPRHLVPSSLAFTDLNDSQREVSAAMISETEPLVIAHGPPGTGKTTTISAAVDWWDENRQPVYIVAQSNVGVKNIARSLFKKGFFDFKLLVSKEFYYEWHEDLYENVVRNVIRTDDLFRIGDPIETERLLGGSRVILCTMSMLSNPALLDCGVFHLVPVERLVVDEASQIDVSQYMHLFHMFKDLRKVCAFGDPKQLPPYGRDVAPCLQSIFEIKHLRPRAYFLDTQYRMPVPLGDFISHHVYDNKLKSHHKIRDTSCVAFVNASKGREESVGKSWKNIEEVNVIVTLVKEYYGKLNYCIITPYDAQRAAIVKALDAQNIPSDRVYNVDSFQGHEAPYVLLSTVRTTRPGFLALQERTNVMLTRCEAGMVIVANEDFVRYMARNTLLGKLAARWAEQATRNVWIDWRRVAEKTADLPGVLAPARAREVAKANALAHSEARATNKMFDELSTGLAQLRLPHPQDVVPAQRSWRTKEVQMEKEKERHTSLVKLNKNFPALGDDSELPKNTLKGRWKQGSEVVKSSRSYW